MMVLDHVGDQEAMVYAQLGQKPLARTTETSPELNPGTLSCLSRRGLLISLMRQEHGPDASGLHVPEHCPISILQAHGGGAIPGFALWTTERFVAVSSEPLVDLPWRANRQDSLCALPFITVGGGPVAAEGETMLTSLMVSCSVAQAMHL